MTGPSGTTASTSDAYGQQGTQGTQASTYDALGRDTALTNGAATTALAYEGTTGQLAGDGASAYTWTPAGTLTGTAPAAAPGTGVLDLTDHHTDLTAQFTASGTTLTGSRAYGPWGATLATGGILSGALGYQSQYTSPATGQVNMGARWYNPANGSFGNKDTVSNKPVPDSASASPFGYAADNPLGITDPTGHRPIDDSGNTDKGWLAAQVTAAKKAATTAASAAHAAHLAHLAHLAVVAKTAPVAAKIPTFCGANNGAGAMGTLNTCMSAIYNAAGGSNYNSKLASEAMGIVQDQYNTVQDAANKRDAQQAAGRPDQAGQFQLSVAIGAGKGLFGIIDSTANLIPDQLLRNGALRSPIWHVDLAGSFTSWADARAAHYPRAA